MIIRLLIQLAALPLCVSGNVTWIHRSWTAKILFVMSTDTVCFNCVSAELSPKSVDQTPAAMIKDPGEKVLMNCSHSDSNLYMIQWYKQSIRSSGITLIGYARYNSVAVEGPFKEIYNVSGDGRSLSSLHFLTVNGAEDSVVYFCAASDARCCINPLSLTKNIQHNHSIHLL